MKVGAFVSCDIAGHSARQISEQRERIFALNEIVRGVLKRNSDAFWASGGDGGHTIFLGSEWPEESLKLLQELDSWGRSKEVPLRIVAHYGEVGQLNGADDRSQFFGNGINFAGRLLAHVPKGMIVVSEAYFEALAASNHQVRESFPYKSLLYLKNFGIQRVRLQFSAAKAGSIWQETSDRISLQNAIETQSVWGTVLFSKRIMQTNSLDPIAEEALESIGSHLLIYERQNEDGNSQTSTTPFLSALV